VRSLTSRFGAALLVFALVTLLSVGGALWLALRDLHRDAALGSLAELTVPYASQARQRFPPDTLGPAGRHGDDDPGAYQEGLDGQLVNDAFEEFVEQAQEEMQAAGISILLVSDSAAVAFDPATSTGTLVAAPGIQKPATSGAVATGTTTVAGLGQVLYAATLIRDPLADRTVPTLMLVRADDSERLATADLAKALAAAGLVLLLVGIPLAYGLSRSVSRPLRRLAAASGTVAAGRVPEPLPTGGPAEVAEASAAFNAMAAEVEATRQAQKQLLADVRHDLRTPLTVIAGFAEALRDGTARGASAERAATAISDEAGRLERMLNDLDHLTIPGSDSPPLRLEPLLALELARGSVERFAAEAAAREQSLDLAEDAPRAGAATLIGDRDALDRILGNIVANALQHAPSPGGHVRVEVRAVAPADGPVGGPGGWSGRAGIMLAVRDDGPGIPPASLPHVFDRFYRADASRARRGSGLGLAIVRDLADALGGRVFAQNVAGGGARVGVVLPAAVPLSAPPVGSRVPRPPAVPSAGQVAEGRVEAPPRAS
jgi:signal transduction histidine kinase